MKYRCLRTCYVNDRLWHEGNVYDLPDSMNKSEKNFKPVEDTPAAESKPENVKPVIPEGKYWCTKCKSLHKDDSKKGKKHKKYKEQ